MTAAPVKTFDYSIEKMDFQINFYPTTQTPPADTGKLIEFFELWNSLRKDRRIPSYEDITFENLKGWHSNIRLVGLGDRVSLPRKNQIVGETYKQFWGTETLYARLYNTKNTDDKYKKQFHLSIVCLCNFNYGLSIGNAENDKGVRQNIAWIELPLTRDDPNEITHVVSALVVLE